MDDFFYEIYRMSDFAVNLLKFKYRSVIMSMIKTVFDSFNVLHDVMYMSGTNDKLGKLKANSENSVLKNLLYLTYNLYLQFYIKKIPYVGCIQRKKPQ